MADDMNFESFDDLDDLDWSELEKDVQEEAQPAEGGETEAQPTEGGKAAAAPALASPGQVGSGSTSQLEIGYLMDVSLLVTVEIGRTYSFISNVLSWDRGSIIELDKLVGAPLNLLINRKQVAKGEVVVVNEKFAIKITEVLDPKDRLNYLQV